MTSLTQRFFAIEIDRPQRTQYILITLWILSMIALPILKWVFGETVIPLAVTAALLLQFAAVFCVLYEAWGLRRVLLTFLVVALLTWTAEFIGSSTGFPFGDYSYTDRLQPQFGHVPLLIPIAWFMMLPATWTVAQSLVGRHNAVLYSAVSAAALTAWDLFLDPQMVDWGFWVWHQPGAYFGIPFVNFAGWFGTALIVTMVVRPHRWELPAFPLLLIYGVVWFLQSIGLAVFWEQPGPALVGSLVMGFFVVSGVQRHLKATS